MSSSYLIKQRRENGNRFRFGPQTSHYVTYHEHCLPGFGAIPLRTPYGPKVCIALPTSAETNPKGSALSAKLDIPKLPSWPKLESYRTGTDDGPFTRKLIPYSKTYYTDQSKNLYEPTTKMAMITNPGLKGPPDWEELIAKDYPHISGDKVGELLWGREDVEKGIWEIPPEMEGKDGWIRASGLEQMCRDGTGLLPYGRSRLKHQ
jgi:hypothetical protein